MRVVFHDNSDNGVHAQEDLGKPMGGRVTCLKEVSKELAKLGAEVDLLMPGIPTPFESDGVTWTSRAQGEYDAFVHVRGLPGQFPPVKTRKRYLWTRDLPHAGFGPDPRLFDEVDGVVFLSQYAERIWRTYFRNIGASTIIPNGVSDLFRPLVKESGLVIHAAHPIRGLRYLPEIWPTVKTLHPEARLVAFSDAALHPGEAQDPEYLRAADACREVEIEVMQPVPPAEFAGWLGKAEFNLMPSNYPEICSNTILQSLRCGTPVVTTGELGSAPEWVTTWKNGVLTETRPEDYMVYRLELARIAHALLAEPEVLRRLQQRAASTPVWTWKEVAEKWMADLLSF